MLCLVLFRQARSDEHGLGARHAALDVHAVRLHRRYDVRQVLQHVRIIFLNEQVDAVAEGRYAEDTYERETLPNPVPNTLSEAKAKEIPGFTAQPFDQVIVNGDGSTTVDIYYDRNPVTLTFDPNGGYFVDSKTSQRSENSIEITQVYGTTVSFRNPKFEGSNMSIDFYNWVPVDTATTLKTTGGDFISFPIPSTSGTYRALWDFSTSVGNLSGALNTMPASGGKLTLTGEVNSGSLSSMKSTFWSIKDDATKQIELNLSDLQVAENQELVFDSNQNSAIMNNLALTKIELPKSGTVTLGVNAFKRCANLESITISPNVEIAGTNPFWGCYKVEFDVASNHPTLLASKDKKALLRKPQNSEEGYTLVSYPSATGVVDLGALGYPITIIGKEALGYIPKGETTIIFPESVKIIRELAVTQEDYVKELTIVMEGVTPPELPDEPGQKDVFSTLASETCIHVPDDSVNVYKNAPGWSNYADDIYPMSAYPNKH